MVAAIADLIEAGRVKLYCVDAIDGPPGTTSRSRSRSAAAATPSTRSGSSAPSCQFIADDCGGAQEIAVTGPSFGAYHAANFALKRADIFPLALCQSGIYDVSAVGWGERGDAVYFNNPADYVRTCTATTSNGCAPG